MKHTERRVVVTGLGMITPLGVGVEANLCSLRNGLSGIRPIRAFDASGFPTTIAGEVPDFQSSVNLNGESAAHSLSKKATFLCGAAEMAVREARINDVDLQWVRAGAYLGVGLTFPEKLEDELIESSEPEFLAYRRKQFSGTRAQDLFERFGPHGWPVDFPERILASKYGLGGPVAAFTSACSASAHAIGTAFHSIRSGRADIFLAGGCDAMITPLGLAGFCLLEVTTRRCEDAARACRPFDRTRDGTVVAEGAVVLVLEEYGCASRRGVTPLAEVTGFGATSDAYRLTDTPPDGEGIRRAMVMALADAGIEGEQLDYINAHGTGTPQNDVSETRAFKALLGPRAASVPISSTKSMTGHMVAAAGAMEAAICVLALRHGIIFPTKNLREPDPECDLDYVPEKSRQANLRTILSNSCGLGGQNASLVFRKAD